MTETPVREGGAEFPADVPGSLDVSVVIPTKNGSDRVEHLLPKLERVLPSYSEIVIVDDGSAPNHACRLDELANRRCRVLHLSCNRGQQLATMAGVMVTRGRWVVTMDDDGHPPTLLPVMIERVAGGARLVYGYPVYSSRRGISGLIRLTGTWANNTLFTLFLGKRRGDRVTSFRIIERELARKALVRPVSFPYFSAMVLHFRPTVETVRFMVGSSGDGSGGVTRYSLRRLFSVFSSLVLFWGPAAPLGRRFRKPVSVLSLLQSECATSDEIGDATVRTTIRETVPKPFGGAGVS